MVFENKKSTTLFTRHHCDITTSHKSLCREYKRIYNSKAFHKTLDRMLGMHFSSCSPSSSTKIYMIRFLFFTHYLIFIQFFFFFLSVCVLPFTVEICKIFITSSIYIQTRKCMWRYMYIYSHIVRAFFFFMSATATN